MTYPYTTSGAESDRGVRRHLGTLAGDNAYRANRLQAMIGSAEGRQRAGLPPYTEQTGPRGDFLQEARAVAADTGLPLYKAMIQVKARFPGLHGAYKRALGATVHQG